ncbi:MULTISPECIES: hypothetical protein [unclassified Cellulophaga]|uniref:hypothetical protein n=1 Tax=unclassified Cellulophaga TaxID=2634405 RepID=UPI0026E3BD9C|nr:MULTISPECIES: hypothetical protein [unclassified Cellulophaga]MDO6492497.1 hypothetical protein [Cellulophaga sp. 2_MG-2023]MDO6493599.1 hypothetical protein [Cellulophaga sp. 3_MG-2023]
MKNTLKITFILIMLAITSCGSDKDTIRISTLEGLQAAKQLAITSFGADLEVYRFELYSKEDLNSDLGSITIKYLKDGKLYSRRYATKTSHVEATLEDEEALSDTFQKNFYIKNAQGKLKISDIDVDAMFSNINKGVVLIEDEMEIDNYQVRKYYIEANSKTNKVSSDFEIHVTEPNNETIEGRNIVTNFYEVEFEADENGELTIKD